jgi:hypothetical protein
VSKFPEPPGIEALRQIEAETLDLPAGTPLARIHFSAGPHPSHWNRFRHVGPTAARWDHRLPGSSDEPIEQDRAVHYCAPQVDTCAAEVFQATRRNHELFVMAREATSPGNPSQRMQRLLRIISPST